MASVYRKSFTKSLPADAELFTRDGQRFARWKTKGKTRTAPVTSGKDGRPRLQITAATFTAKYRDAAGVVIEHATGCRDETAAKQVLADLVRRAELVKANVITAAENAVADYQTIPLAEHFAAYLDALELDGTTPEHRKNVGRCVHRLAKDCRWQRLLDVTRESLERWLTQRLRAGMGARTRNLHRASIVALCNWCVDTNRLVTNPLSAATKADERTDRRRERRALTEAELTKLLRVARWRPLAEYGRETIRKPMGETHGRRTWTKACLTLENLDAATERARRSLRDNPAFAEQLDATGRERALIYKTLVLTGLRKGELTSITVGQVELDCAVPHVALRAADEKNREGADVPLRADLVADLREWLAEKPHLPADQPLFRVPRDLFKILDRDLKLAGIPKRDERGRSIDVHALRHSFATLLSRAGVAPRTAQAALRHSTLDLTMNAYTDPKLLDVHGALEGLPALPLDAPPMTTREHLAATGTDGKRSCSLAPTLAPTSDQSGQSVSSADKTDRRAHEHDECEDRVASLAVVKQKQPLTSPVSGCGAERVKGFEPSTYSLGSCHSAN